MNVMILMFSSRAHNALSSTFFLPLFQSFPIMLDSVAMISVQGATVRDNHFYPVISDLQADPIIVCRVEICVFEFRSNFRRT